MPICVPAKAFLQLTLRQVRWEARHPGALPRSSAEDIPLGIFRLSQQLLLARDRMLGLGTVLPLTDVMNTVSIVLRV